MAKDTAVGKKMLAANLDLLSPKHSYLSTFVLQEKYNPLSFWKPYIELLPSDFNSVPIFFTEDELKWLEGSPFLSSFRTFLLLLEYRASSGKEIGYEKRL